MNEVLNLNDFSIKMYENSSVMFAILKVELDENGSPVDWIYVYCNDAFASLSLKYTKNELMGHRFKDLAPDGSDKWLPFCYDAAFNGKTSLLNEFSEEFKKHLHLNVFPAGYEGYCAVLAEDFTAIRDEYNQSLERARKEMRLTLDKEEQFRQATISNSMIVANFNVTKGLIEDEIYERHGDGMRPLLQLTLIFFLLLSHIGNVLYIAGSDNIAG